MKFIRKNGKVIPLREKKDGNVDKRHVSDKALAKKASKLKPKKKNMAAGAALGAFAGYAASKGNKFAALGGALAGLAIGSTRVISKQEAANKLKRKSTGF